MIKNLDPRMMVLAATLCLRESSLRNCTDTLIKPSRLMALRLGNTNRRLTHGVARSPFMAEGDSADVVIQPDRNIVIGATYFTPGNQSRVSGEDGHQLPVQGLLVRFEV